MTVDFRYKDATFVKEITKVLAKEIVARYHYLGDKSFMYSKAYGLFKKRTDDLYYLEEDGTEELIGVAVYSPVTGISALKSWFGLDNTNVDIFELIRLVMAPEHNGKNGASFLVGRSLRLLKKAGIRGVVSLADSEHHTGYIYQATNFKYYGLTDKKTDFFREDGKLNPRGETKTERGVWLERSRKHRYFFSLDGKLCPKFPELPFPKDATKDITCCQGTNKVYDKRFDVTYECPKCKPTEGRLVTC